MNKKNLIATSIMILILATATGCGGQTAESQNTALSLESETENQSRLPSAEDESDNAAALPSEGSETDTSPETDSDDNAPEILPTNVNPDTIFIGGKVRSVAQDSFVISRTLWEDSDDGGSYVSIPEEGSPEEELTTIRCTNTTTFERWTIQGGGAGITTDTASFSEIQSGGGLEAEGYFDGEEFIAERVIIEIYE